MIECKSIEELRKEVRKASKPILVKAQGYEFNLKALELNINVLVSPELSALSSSLRQLESGWNHILAKLAAKKGIALGIDLASIKHLPKIKQAYALSLIRQNIIICRKAKTRLVVIHALDKYSAQAFLHALGASSQQAAQALAF